MARLLIIIILIHLYTNIFPQHKSQNRDHAFSGTLVLSVEGGATYGLTDFSDNIIDYAGRGMIEYFFTTSSASSFGIRVFGGGGYLSGKDKKLEPIELRTSLAFGGGELVYNLSLGDCIFPYVAAGASYLRFDPKVTPVSRIPRDYSYKRNVININGEFGFRFLLSKDLSLNLSSTAFINTHDNLDDDFIQTERKDDIFFTGMAGLSFAFFRRVDSDGDGFENDEDDCMDEPEDFDGYKDNDGCPDNDNDKDHLNDIVDECPDQEEDYDGFYDNDGCPELDNDQDGILDDIDNCPNQKEDFDGHEDNDGCPEYDNDKDGLLDADDKCPNLAETRNGFEDLDGCPDEKLETPKSEIPKEIILSAGTNFSSGKAILNYSAFEALDKIVSVMKENPNTHWRIEGHTDNVGSNQTNKKLSEARANAVLDYFLSKGLDKYRFEIIGLGEDAPIADNKSEEGRTKNRRVVILRIY